MTNEEFAATQQLQTRSALSDLLTRSEMRFLNAANLINLRGPVIERLRRAMSDRQTDLTPLLPVWRLICERYRDDLYDPQASLFEDHRHEILERWRKFVHWELFPALLREDEFVRNVLRAVELLPSHSPAKAIDALLHHIAEIDLPCGVPPWDYPEESV